MGCEMIENEVFGVAVIMPISIAMRRLNQRRFADGALES